MESLTSIFIIKSSFQSFLKNKYGSMLLIFKGNSIENVSVISGVNSELAALNIKNKWTLFEEEINTKLKPELANIWFSEELKKHIFEKLKNETEEFKNKIINFSKENNHKKLSVLFINLLEDIIQDKNMTFNFHIEEKTDTEYSEDIKEKDKKYLENKKLEAEKKIKEAFLLPENCMLAKTEFVISPISGVLISDLKVNDKIYVKLLPDINPDHIINYLKASQNGVMVPILATITQVTKNDQNTYFIVLNFSKNIYSVIEENREIRVKVFEPEANVNEKNIRIEDKIFETKEEESNKKKHDFIFIIIISLLGLILTTLIVLFVIYGL